MHLINAHLMCDISHVCDLEHVNPIPANWIYRIWRNKAHFSFHYATPRLCKDFFTHTHTPDILVQITRLNCNCNYINYWFHGVTIEWDVDNTSLHCISRLQFNVVSYYLFVPCVSHFHIWSMDFCHIGIQKFSDAIFIHIHELQ